MIKLKIKDIETKLGYKIKRNTYVLGVDTASITGLGIAETDNEYLNIITDIFKLPIATKKDEFSEKYIEKLECMLRMIREFKKKLKTKKNSILVLENSFLSVNPVTFGLLRMLCGIVYSEMFDLFETIMLPFPTHARKTVGFKSQLKKGTKSIDKKQEIVKWINNIFDMNETNDNITDAVLLTLYGLKSEQ